MEITKGTGVRVTVPQQGLELEDIGTACCDPQSAGDNADRVFLAYFPGKGSFVLSEGDVEIVAP